MYFDMFQAYLVKQQKTTPYQPLLIRSIFNSITTINDYYADLTEVADAFLNEGWHLFAKWHMRFLRKNATNRTNSLLYQIYDKHQVTKGKQQFSDDLIRNTVNNLLIRNPIYRLQYNFPFYVFTDKHRNKVLSVSDNQSFSTEQEWNMVKSNIEGIFIPKEIVSWIFSHKSLLIASINFQITKFLENIPENYFIPQIASKVEGKLQRKTLNSTYKNLLLNYQNKLCFYCVKPIKQLEFDHFIPWSFLPETKLANMVASCKSCNNSGNKGVKIPNQSLFDKLLRRNRDQSFLNLFSKSTTMKIKEKSRQLHEYYEQSKKVLPSGWSPSNND